MAKEYKFLIDGQWRQSSKKTLELGGNAAVIIHSDADIDFAAKRRQR